MIKILQIFVCVTALILKCTLLLAAQTPHGPFIQNTNACASCHISHAAVGAKLLKSETITGLCLTCHDGTGSSSNTLADFNSADNVYHHPVKDTGNPKIAGLITCTQCHNPHAANSNLLESQNALGKIFTKGTNYCNACHPQYQNNLAAHYDESQDILLPISGTLVTCEKCHQHHAGKYEWLLRDKSDSQCIECHNPEQVAAGKVKREVVSDYAKKSVHDVTYSSLQKLSCTNCHGPHTVSSKETAEKEANASVLSDPDNTKKAFVTKESVTANAYITVGNPTGFCLKCHDGDPPQEPADHSRTVPALKFPKVNFTTNDGGFNKSAYHNSGHNAVNTLCNRCHEAHGSDYPRLNTKPEDTTTQDAQCLRCHNGNNAKAPEVKTSFLKKYAHPTLTVSGKHSDVENYSNLPSEDLHAECSDCHNAHAANDSVGEKPNVSGYQLDVSGVEVATNPAIRPVWTSLPINSESYSFTKSALNGFEICYKCHSSYSFGDKETQGQWDIARAFNPNNPSYHPVEAIGANGMNSAGLDYSASLVSPLQANSIITCSDCHGDSEGRRGVHGSDIKGLLVAPYTVMTGVYEADKSDLCFKCHQWDTYQNTAGNSNTGFYNEKEGNLHIKTHDKVPCMSCHTTVPHGSKRPALIAYTTDSLPISDGSTRIISWNRNTRKYVKGDCTTTEGCHQ